MASSYFTESEAPRDFRVSSTESDGHYTKCVLCYTVKKNFYCPDCIRAGNFVHSSMPYSDRCVYLTVLCLKTYLITIKFCIGLGLYIINKYFPYIPKSESLSTLSIRYSLKIFLQSSIVLNFGVLCKIYYKNIV